jgi:hypothetical protein
MVTEFVLPLSWRPLSTRTVILGNALHTPLLLYKKGRGRFFVNRAHMARLLALYMSIIDDSCTNATAHPHTLVGGDLRKG